MLPTHWPNSVNSVYIRLMALLGINAFFAKSRNYSKKSTTPAHAIMGRFQKLKSLQHRHLCYYIDIIKGKHGSSLIIFFTSYFESYPIANKTDCLLHLNTTLQRLKISWMLLKHKTARTHTSVTTFTKLKSESPPVDLMRKRWDK